MSAGRLFQNGPSNLEEPRAEYQFSILRRRQTTDIHEGRSGVIFHRRRYGSVRNEPDVRSTAYGRGVPITAVSGCSKVYSITSSARVSRVACTVSPPALGV